MMIQQKTQSGRLLSLSVWIVLYFVTHYFDFPPLFTNFTILKEQHPE